MSTLVVDRSLSEKLRAASGVIELRDKAGELIGILNKPKKYSDQDIDLPSDEEIERRLRESKRHTADEVIAHLRKLEEGFK